MRDRVRRTAKSHGDALRVSKRLRRQLFDFGRERGREHHRLALSRYGLDDPLNIRQEAHVEHAVRLIQHQDLYLAQFQHALVVEVEQATGAGDQYLRPVAQGLDLRPC